MSSFAILGWLVVIAPTSAGIFGLGRPDPGRAACKALAKLLRERKEVSTLEEAHKQWLLKEGGWTSLDLSTLSAQVVNLAGQRLMNLTSGGREDPDSKAFKVVSQIVDLLDSGKPRDAARLLTAL